MGWFSNLCSSLASKVSSVASAVIDKGKEVAARAIGFMANEAEALVGKVKQVWTTVKPFLTTASILAKGAAAATRAYPWVSGALTVIGRALDALVAFDQSKLAERLDAAIKWAIAFAKKLQAHLTDAEMAESQTHKQSIDEAAQAVDAANRHALEVAGFLIASMQVRRRIDDVLKVDSIPDFEHYLRLRAAQKLLANAEQTLQSAQSVEAITTDDMFLVKVGDSLLSDTPVLTDADADRLDAIVKVRFGKSLQPFVFEELLIAWFGEHQAREAAQKKLETELIDLNIEFTRMVRKHKQGRLTEPELQTLDKTRVRVEQGTEELHSIRTRNTESKVFLQAAEGFLQIMEKDEATLEREDIVYLADRGAQVGEIIITCLQNNRPWSLLSEDDQALVIAFSNLFEAASKLRAAQLIQVNA